MDVPKIDSVSTGNFVNHTTPSTDKDVPQRQIVAAVHAVNKGELMGEGRQLLFARDPDTRKPIIQIVDRDSGDVIDQIPPETVLQLAEQLK